MPISSLGNAVESPHDVPIAGSTPSTKADPGYISMNPHARYMTQAME